MVFKKFGNYRFAIPIFLLITIYLIWIGISGAPIHPFDADEGGSKFRLFQNHADIADWNEWWYTNFYDENLKIGGNVLLFTRGDLNSFKNIIGLHVDVFNHSENFVAIGEVISEEQYSSEEHTTDVIMGQSRFRMLKPDKYELYIKPEGKNFELNLTYERVTLGFSKKGSFLGEEAFATIPIPLAKVDGYIIYDNGKKLYINGKGYCEHYYGIWRDVEWDWGIVGNLVDKFSITFSKAEIKNKTIGHITVTDDKEIIVILYPDMDVESVEYGTQSPDEYHIYGEKDGFVVDLHASPVGDLRIYYFTGNVTKNSEIVYSLQDEIGFFEHIYK